MSITNNHLLIIIHHQYTINIVNYGLSSIIIVISHCWSQTSTSESSSQHIIIIINHGYH